MLFKRIHRRTDDVHVERLMQAELLKRTATTPARPLWVRAHCSTPDARSSTLTVHVWFLCGWDSNGNELRESWQEDENSSACGARVCFLAQSATCHCTQSVTCHCAQAPSCLVSQRALQKQRISGVRDLRETNHGSLRAFSSRPKQPP